MLSFDLDHRSLECLKAIRTFLDTDSSSGYFLESDYSRLASYGVGAGTARVLIPRLVVAGYLKKAEVYDGPDEPTLILELTYEGIEICEEDNLSGEIPASDRFVNRDDNAVPFDVAHNAIKDLTSSISKTNIPGLRAEERLAVTSELTGLSGAFEKGTIRLGALRSILDKATGLLPLLVKKFAETSVEELVKACIRTIQKLLGLG